MTDRHARKPYAKPALRKHDRLSDVAEGTNIFVTGQSANVKGGCFSNKR